MQQLTTSNPATNETALFQHRTCPHWGLAVLAWERENKRGYQFEDGKLRIFTRDYFDRLEAVDRPLDVQARALDQLSRHIGSRRAAKRNGTEHPTISFSRQVDYFRAQFPKGFQSASFAKKHRGMGAPKPLKRHRNPAVKLARSLFTEERVRAALASNNAAALLADFASLFDSTDLVTKAQSRGFESMGESHAHRVVSALAELVWGEGPLRSRFDRSTSALNRALPRGANWAIATAVPALLLPAELVAVKATTFARQAAWMAPNLVVDMNIDAPVNQNGNVLQGTNVNMATPFRRLIGAPGAASSFALDAVAYQGRFTFVRKNSSARTLFYDVGMGITPDFVAIDLLPAIDQRPMGTSIRLRVLGADCVSGVPGCPTTPNITGSTGNQEYISRDGVIDQAALTALFGKRFIRMIFDLEANVVTNVVPFIESMLIGYTF